MNKDKIDVALFFIAKLITGVLGILTITMISKFLPVDAYGNYSLITGISNALISIFIGWIGSSLLRYYIDYQNSKKERRKLIANTWIFTVAMILLILLIEIAIGYITKTIPIIPYLFNTSYYVISFSLVEIMEKAFRASGKTKIYALCTILQSAINILIFILLSTTNLDAVNMALISIASSRLFFVIVAIITLSFIIPITKIKLDKALLKKFLHFGIPMIGVWGISWLLNYCDRYIIALFYSTSEVGLYDMSYKIAEDTINIIVSSFTLAIYPILIKLWKTKGKKSVADKLTKFTKYYCLLVIPSVIGIISISNNLYGTVIDEKYIGGSEVIAPISIGMFFNGLTAIYNKVWQLNEKTKNILKIMLISLILNIALNLIFIPLFGFIAAAYTTLFSYIISFTITYTLSKREISIKVDIIGFLKTITATVLMYILIIILNTFIGNTFFTLIIKIIIAAVFYGILNIVFKNLDGLTVKRRKHGTGNNRNI